MATATRFEKTVERVVKETVKEPHVRLELTMDEAETLRSLLAYSVSGDASTYNLQATAIWQEIASVTPYTAPRFTGVAYANPLPKD